MEDEGSKQRRVEFSFPILTVRTQLFTRVFDRLGAFRFSRFASWVALVIVPVVAGIGLYLVINSLFALLWNPAAADAAREVGLGGYLLLPGINPYLPLLYGWFAIVCAIVIHEGAHGVAARSLGLKVKSSGLLFFLFVPIGAFVDVDEEQLKKVSGRVSSRVMAAGVGGNVVVAAVCLIGLLVIVGGLAPVINGVYVSEITEGLLTEERLRNYQNVTPAGLVLYLVPPALAPGLVPFSDSLIPFYSHAWLGAQWHVWANVLFWLWFVNVNLAVFNALPIYPLDGGRMFNIALKRVIRRKESEKIVK